VSLFSRLYAAGYDRWMARLDRKGGEEHRRRLVEDAEGEVLEVGAGTGMNLPHYRKASRVVGLEPDPGMRARAERRAHRAAVPAEVVDGDGMNLPFPDDSFDTVVFGLVLCTIPDPASALSEARRVLRPGGRLRFYEHVRSTDPKVARSQDRFERPWRWFGRGCHPNRDTPSTIEGTGFEVSVLDRFEMPGVPRIVRPHVEGVARPAEPVADSGDAGVARNT
jgi:ubiquinone/menaquinone biosynthesis C-methylase UbiE